jgi:hypothetical protein
MSKTPTLAILLAGVFAVAGLMAECDVATAADLPIPVKGARASRWCGPCGCLHVTYNYHRELLATYGIGFDPRNYDTTEPHYFHAAMRAYPRYWVAGNSVR